MPKPDEPTIEELKARVQALEAVLRERRNAGDGQRPWPAPSDSLLTDASVITFEALFDIVEIQRLQDDFAHATRVASIITRVDGTPITRPSNFCRLCREIIRQTEKGAANCCQSDAEIGQLSPHGPIVKPCSSGGLWDAGAGISVGGRHIANWLIGQVRDETQTEAGMRAYAREIGADETLVIEAFREVPIMPKTQFEKIARMLFTLAKQLSTMAYQNVQQRRIIADCRKAEEAFKESEARLGTLIRTIPDLVWLKDQEGVYLFCNSRFEQFFGAAEKDIIGKTDYDFVDKAQADFFRRHDELAIAKGGPSRNEEAVVFSDDGHREILETIKTPMYRANGKLIGVLGIGRNTTERKRMEENLKRSRLRYRKLYQASLQREKLYESLLKSIPDALAIYNLSGETVYINPAFTQTFGFQLEEVQGKRIPFVPPDEVEKSLAAIRKVLEGEPVKSMETRRLAKDGRLLDIALSSSAYDDHAGNPAGIVVFLRDVTQIKQTEGQLLQAQKMESVGRLAGGVAHDFNNMLSVILGYTELELSQLDQDQPLFATLQSIREAAQRSAELTRKLLAFARKQTVSPSVLDLNQILEGMLRMLQRLLGEDIDLVWQPALNLWPVKVDASQIDQLLTNLCVNARDAIQDVGKITIETGMTSFDAAYCAEHRGFIPGDYIVLAVSDDGCGMDKETVDKIFEPFFTTKGELKGTGLGLSTVYGIVKQNQGFINVYSEPGEGTTFRIYLPRHRGAEGDEGPRPQTEAIPQGHGETVLVVEDEALILQLTERFLKSLGYQVLTARSPSEALELATVHQSRIALVLTDVVMPELNGRELAERLNAVSPSIKCLFMSGYTANVIAHHGVLDEGVTFVQKPFSKKTLAIKVREALEKG